MTKFLQDENAIIQYFAYGNIFGLTWASNPDWERKGEQPEPETLASALYKTRCSVIHEATPDEYHLQLVPEGDEPMFALVPFRSWQMTVVTWRSIIRGLQMAVILASESKGAQFRGSGDLELIGEVRPINDWFGERTHIMEKIDQKLGKDKPS